MVSRRNFLGYWNDKTKEKSTKFERALQKVALTLTSRPKNLKTSFFLYLISEFEVSKPF